MPTDKDPFPSVPDKKEVGTEQLEELARIIQKNVVEKVSEQALDQQDNVERARGKNGKWCVADLIKRGAK